MQTRLTELAAQELDEAVSYYEFQQPGLGVSFLQEVDHAISRINQFPAAWQAVGENHRRCLIHRFPYAVFYVCEEDSILVTAIANLHRNPTTYLDRLD